MADAVGMNWGRRPCRAGALRKDERAQVHVMEVVTAAMLVISAIQALIAAHVPTDVEEIDLTDIRLVGEDALNVLSKQPASDPSQRYDNVLTMHLTNGDVDLLRENLTALIPTEYSFNLYLSNATATLPLGPVATPLGDAIVAHRLVCLRQNPFENDVGGTVLAVQVLVWRELR